VGLQQDIARSHLETLIERIAGIEKAVPDQDGDYFIRTEKAGFFARVDGEDPPVIRVFSIVANEIDKSPDLLDSLNEINTQLSFLRSMWIRQQVLIEGETLALTTGMAEFAEICRRVASATDYFGPGLIGRFGGQSFFEDTKKVDYAPEPPASPGYL
jgi:hypothetical protein